MGFVARFLVFMSLFTGLVSGFALQKLPLIQFDEGYTHLFGDQNMIVNRDGKSVRLILDERTGSGFVSNDIYLHGFFSSSIKLPADYSAGVVIAFYLSNGDIYEKNHDEIDFEFLGNIRGKEWRIQTNIYGNGSTHLGREERYNLWFDPTEDFHQYSIMWSHSHIIFYVDNIPIREVKRTASMGGDFPAKPMSSYATIWDGSKWATNGGKYGVNYKFAPYVAQFTDMILHGCAVDPMEKVLSCQDGAAEDLRLASEITESQRKKMDSLRRKHMTYSYCYDRTRYKVALPECVVNPEEAKRLRVYDPVTFGGIPHRHRHGKHRSSNLPNLISISVDKKKHSTSEMTLANIKKSPLARLRSKLSSRKSESSVDEEEARRSTSSNRSSSLNVDELRTVFDYIDANSDGKISGTELQSCVSLLGGALSSREAEEVVKISDVDGDGLMDFEEFLKLMEGEDGSDEERRKELREAFRMYVTEGEEFITAASLRRTLSRLGESCTVDACKVMIRGFDQNGDGVLSFDEFLLMMR